MRWENLFADLDAQLIELEQAELALEVADRTRREIAQLRLVDRLRPAFGHLVGVTTVGGGAMRGRIRGVGADWLLLSEDYGMEGLIPFAAITGVTGLGAFTATPGSEGAVGSKLTLGYALRKVAQDRAPVAVVFCDGMSITGTVDRVGADFFELAEHPPGEVRRPREVVRIRTIPNACIACLRRP